MKIKVLKLGSVVKDKATRCHGTLTHWMINMDQQIEYLFQPKGTNPEDGQPLNKIFLGPARLETTEDQFEEVEVPFEILGTEVTDDPSGFQGTAVDFVRHIDGCFHVTIQPYGRLSKTNFPIRKAEFSLRLCSGPMIKKLSEQELKKSRDEDPSPADTTHDEFMPSSDIGIIR